MNKYIKKLLRIFMAAFILESIIFTVPVQAEEISKTETIKLTQEYKYLRTEYNKTYLLSNGLMAKELYTVPIHYKDDYQNDNEQWKDIDLTIKDGKIDKAPYILTIDGDTYNIVSKKTGDTLTITGPGQIEPFNTGFRLMRTVNSVDELSSKADADFLITQKGTSISVKANAHDADGKIIPVNYDVSNGILTEKIDKKSLSGFKYPFTIDPTIDIAVNASANDGYSNAGTFNNNGTVIFIGAVGVQATDGFFFYPNITGLSGANITNATFDQYVSTLDAAALTKVYADNQSSPVTVANITDHAARVRTAAGVDFDSYNTTGWLSASVGAINVTSVIQELADNFDPSAILILHDDDGSPANGYPFIYTYDQNPTYGAKLYIEYTPAGGVSPPTVTSVSSGSITSTTALLTGNITNTGGANCTARFFQWGTSSGVYTDNVSESGNFSTGLFSLNATGLSAGTVVYWRSGATNQAGTSYGDEKYFITLGYSSWMYSSGESDYTCNVSAGQTYYHFLNSFALRRTSENVWKTAMPDDYIIDNLFVRVVSNNATGDSTFTLRLNGADTDLTITVAANTTGLFYDTTHSVAVTEGDLVNYETTVAAGAGIIGIGVIGCRAIGSPSAKTFISANDINVQDWNEGYNYISPSGGMYHSSNESSLQYTIRSDATFSNFRIYVEANTLNGTAIATVRKNGANATQTISIPAGATGNFTDTVNTDSFTAGDKLSIQVSTTNSTTGSIGYTNIQMYCDGNPIKAISYPTGVIAFGTQTYHAYGDVIEETSDNETYVSAPATCNFTASKLFVNVSSNNLNSSANISLRVNGVDALVLSVPASTRGIIENTSDSVDIITGDLINFSVSAGGTVGGIVANLIGITESQTTNTPVVVTVNASSLTCNSTIGNGNITSIGSGNVTTRGFQYGIGAFDNSVNETGNWGTGNYTVAITGLLPNAEYQYRAVVQNPYGVAYGDSVNFTTSAASNPTFTTIAASSITTTSANLNGLITGLDCLDADDVIWQWGTVSGVYTDNYTNTSNQSNGIVNYGVSGLPSNTTIYFRGGARLTGGAYVFGAELSFTTSVSDIGSFLMENILPLIIACAIIISSVLLLQSNPKLMFVGIMIGILAFYIVKQMLS